jgi:hypothetical protein
MTRAADDFRAIRARLDELRYERARVAADDERRRADGRRPHDMAHEEPFTDNRAATRQQHSRLWSPR